MSEFKLPNLSEAENRLDQVFASAFTSDHPTMHDWVAVKFALKELASTLATLHALREAVEAAPHAEMCHAISASVFRSCTCWKSRALALSAQEPASAWHTMDSAPKDGTRILYAVAGSSRVDITYWNELYAEWQHAASASAWQPLPPPPALAPTEGEGA